MLFLFIEIVLVAVMASKLGMEASDKGLSKILFMILTGIVWVGARILGNIMGIIISNNNWITLLLGWVAGLTAYIIFYWIISRMEDKYDFDEEKSWEKRNEGHQGPQQ